MSIGAFRTAAAEARFHVAYLQAMRRWPVPRDDLDLETPYGSTRVYRSGSGPPIVLLPGAGGTSAAWIPFVAGLAQSHTVHAVDILGDVGLSVQRRNFDQPHDCTAWLDAVLRRLDVTGVHLVGVGHGGWLALNQALHEPERLATITAIEPKTGLRSRNDRSTRDFRYGQLRPRRLTDDQLRSITTPAMLVLDTVKSRGLMPDACVERARFDQPVLLTRLLLDFMAR